MLTRDRSKTYALGMSEGAPAAVQIADRWHLMNNLVEAVESIVAQYRERLVCQSTAEQEEDMPSEATEAELLALQTKLSPRQTSLLDPYYVYLNKRWEEGCRNTAQLHREIQQQGFAGSYGLVAQYGWLRRRNMVTHKNGTWRATSQQPSTNIKRYTPRQAAFLFVQHEGQLDQVEKDDLTRIVSDCPELSTTYQLAQEFTTLLRHREVATLDSWIQKTQAAGVAAMRSFANGIERDYPEVRAALAHRWSNGPVEGHVNRLKMIKRHMFGRANFDLLRLRVLHRF